MRQYNALPHIIGQSLLKFSNFRTENIATMIKNGFDSTIQILPNQALLRFKVYEFHSEK